MEKNSCVIKSIVKVDELKPGMKIVEYLGLDSIYGPIDDKICRFIKINFKGTKIVILRYQRKKEILSINLQTKDVILKIYDFPDSIKKLVQVNDKLIKILKAKKLSKFKVQHAVFLPSGYRDNIKDIIQMLNGIYTKHHDQPERLLSNRINGTNQLVLKTNKRKITKKKRQILLEKQAHKLIEVVNQSVGIREDATKAVEFYMDRARKGKVCEKEIKSYVDDIAFKASSEAISAIMNLKKSDQTYGHCIDVAALFNSVYYKLLRKNHKKSVFNQKNEALLGSFLHDFGKAKIPKYIIDSVCPFSKDSEEVAMMKSHPKFGAKLLMDEMNMSSSIVNMALLHHVKLDNNMSTSYPEEFDYNSVIYETKLLSIVDTYQALVGERKYKRSWAPAAAMRYLDAVAGIEFDKEIWEDFKQVMGIYPKGTVVQLNDNSLGFVMSVPEIDLDNPAIAVFRNASKQDLETHPLIDLQTNPDFSIQNDLDHYEVFGNGKNSLDKFKNIKIA